MKKEKNMRGKEMKKMDKGTNAKKTEKLWNQSDNTWQKAIKGVYS